MCGALTEERRRRAATNQHASSAEPSAAEPTPEPAATEPASVEPAAALPSAEPSAAEPAASKPALPLSLTTARPPAAPQGSRRWPRLPRRYHWTAAAALGSWEPAAAEATKTWWLRSGSRWHT